MAETTASDRPGPASSQPAGLPMTRRRWSELTGVLVLMLALGFVGGYSLGRHWDYQDVAKWRDDDIKLGHENSQLTMMIKDQKAAIDKLTAQLKTAQDDLEQGFQPTRQIKLDPNQAMRLSIGAFSVGLANALGNTSVNLNINGKQQEIAPGDVVNLTFNCQVELQSFSVVGSSDTANSSATVNTNCSAPSPPNATRK